MITCANTGVKKNNDPRRIRSYLSTWINNIQLDNSKENKTKITFFIQRNDARRKMTTTVNKNKYGLPYIQDILLYQKPRNHFI